MIAFLCFVVIISIVYTHVGWDNIAQCLKKLFTVEYWEPNYNKVEFAAWLCKGLIIVPGLVFGIEIWQLHFLSLTTSSLLIWCSQKKALPTLILFNTLWVAISTIIICRNLLRISYGY